MGLNLNAFLGLTLGCGFGPPCTARMVAAVQSYMRCDASLLRCYLPALLEHPPLPPPNTPARMQSRRRASTCPRCRTATCPTCCFPTLATSAAAFRRCHDATQSRPTTLRAPGSPPRPPPDTHAPSFLALFPAITAGKPPQCIWHLATSYHLVYYRGPSLCTRSLKAVL